jgi:thiol-disulfide isomerase/thioredoxin
MIKKALAVVASFVVVLVATAAVLYLRNAPPAVPAISQAEVMDTAKPIVVKLHAQWCPVCMVTKDVWSEIAAAYAGRVHLVVFDFTNEAATNASRAEAHRLGLDVFFNENEGWTGTIAVLDGRTKEATAVIHGSRDEREYHAAIDAALR